MTRTRKVTAVRTAKLLGTAAGGRRRSTKLQRSRLKNVHLEAKRIKSLTRTKVKVHMLARAAGTPAITYGWDIRGLLILS